MAVWAVKGLTTTRSLLFHVTVTIMAIGSSHEPVDLVGNKDFTGSSLATGHVSKTLFGSMGGDINMSTTDLILQPGINKTPRAVKETDGQPVW